MAEWPTPLQVWPACSRWPLEVTEEPVTALVLLCKISQKAAVTCELNFCLNKARSLRLKRLPHEWALFNRGRLPLEPRPLLLLLFTTLQLLTEVVSEKLWGRRPWLFSLSSASIQIVLVGRLATKSSATVETLSLTSPSSAASFWSKEKKRKKRDYCKINITRNCF